MTDPVSQFVITTIASDKVVIFSKSTCPYCTMAKEVFDELKQKYTLIELNKREGAAEIQNVLAKMTGARTVPRVFVNGKCIGGGSDVKALHQNGKLKPMLI
uniref:Glutaredoxin-2, mitochondrial n=1 Tax=Graphocephala atropunctata TaxID=36148 RepID=A0A1B6LAX0_9HEMI